MKISIITATWNSVDTIGDTMRSLSSQKYSNIEHIVVDGASTDGTLEVVREIGRDGVVLISEKDNGIYDALNKGIKIATGEIVGFLHSDDYYAHERVLQLVADAFSDVSVNGVYGDLEYVSQKNSDTVVRQWLSGKYDRNKIRNGWMPPHPTFYMRNRVYKQLGGFDTSYRIAADYESILRYLWKNSLAVEYIPEVMIKMRMGGASNQSLSNIILKTKEDMRAIKGNNLPLLRTILGKNISKLPQFFLI